MSLLITRPRYDPATHYLYYWATKIIETAQRQQLIIFDLEKEKASRKTLESYLNKQQPEIVVFNGHGSSTAMIGQDNEVLISANDNEGVLNGKKIFMRACDAGKILGPKIKEAGARGFIGYKEPFVFLHDNNKFNRPLEDELARPYLEASNHIAINLIKGCSIREAHDAGLKRHREEINGMLTSNREATHMLPFLYWNMINQICID